MLVTVPTLANPPDFKAASTPFSHSAVQPASLITDLLAAFNTTSVALGNATQIGIDTAAGLPLGLAGAANAVITDPSKIPDIINFLAYSFLYPDAPPATPVPGLSLPPSLLYQFGTEVVVPLALLLPAPIATFVLTAFGQLGNAIGAGLALLPGNPIAGFFAVGAGVLGLPDFIGSSLEQFKTIGEALGFAIGGGFRVAPAESGIAPTQGIAGWVGALPAVLVASFGAAIANPTQIPGLVSYLAYSLLAAPGAAFPPPGSPPFASPFGSFSLFTAGFAPIAAALEEILPPALAEAFGQLSGILGDVIANVLNLLPAPINPTLPAMALVAARTATPSISETSVDSFETSLKVVVDDATTLSDEVEGPVDGQDDALPNPEASPVGSLPAAVDAPVPAAEPVETLQADVITSNPSDDITAIPDPPKKPEFNVVRNLDPFQAADSEEGPDAADGGDVAKHQEGEGKISVQDLAQRLADANDGESEKPTADQADQTDGQAAATG
ncbi:hypothetical protein [Mycolicibacterium lacusdiani]|uniref:hypothetical protein n=1 Tax=Mycolicibacterium lacusdiani TaxID=2895283 RepID=UPI001F327F00|nr:hypothetical protein [Mycolicibacterium lacusdiani]